MSKIKHILVIRLSAMGDVAMVAPLLRAFVSQYPHVKITVVSRPFFKPFFAAIPNVVFFDVDLHGRHKGPKGLLRLFLDLRRLKADAVADLHNAIRSKVIRKLFGLIGKKVVYMDKGRKEKEALTRTENKIFQPLLSTFERHALAFKKLGFPIDLSHPVFPAKLELSEISLNVTGPKQGKWIGIAPFAQYDTKMYPLDLMQQVIDELAKDATVKIFLFGGGQDEVDHLETMKKEHPNVIVIAGKLKLQQEMEVISNLDIMVSMDSGNGHIAAMLGVKVITIWGATHPYAGFTPFNQPLENSLIPDREKYPLLPTSVYGNKIIEGYEDVMRTITPESIIRKIKSFI
ncbi:glycosyltransferase family 9 protein [Flavobacterium cerinum]|uniref:Glycosyltransferase family 9 protein n=1 Tax=Flavobacterium cerinum TaxID=2502784 RepID=A0ABY5ITU2_9FLAO|nr:glycosyltransferase family 9 protein [Flavobacterium cerinum]UUC46261.1 glycosyltransferase family 9 protein [Flavobacterium cerinum]